MTALKISQKKFSSDFRKLWLTMTARAKGMKWSTKYGWKIWSFCWRYHWLCHNGFEGDKITENDVFDCLHAKKKDKYAKANLANCQKTVDNIVEKTSFCWRYHWLCHNGFEWDKITENGVFDCLRAKKRTNMTKKTLRIDKSSWQFFEKSSFCWRHHWSWLNEFEGVKWQKMTFCDHFRSKNDKFAKANLMSCQKNDQHFFWKTLHWNMTYFLQ